MGSAVGAPVAGSAVEVGNGASAVEPHATVRTRATSRAAETITLFVDGIHTLFNLWIVARRNLIMKAAFLPGISKVGGHIS